MKETPTCELCCEDIQTQFTWNISACYANYTSAYRAKWCKKCLNEKLDIPVVVLEFAELLVQFRREHKLSVWVPWNKHTKNAFKKRVRARGLPFYRYGIELCRKEWRGGLYGKVLFADICTEEELEMVRE